MTGREAAEGFWGILRKKGFRVMDGDWDSVEPKVQAAWDEFAKEISGQYPHPAGMDDWIQLVLDWPEDARQRLYTLLNAKGHRIR